MEQCRAIVTAAEGRALVAAVAARVPSSALVPLTPPPVVAPSPPVAPSPVDDEPLPFPDEAAGAAAAASLFGMLRRGVDAMCLLATRPAPEPPVINVAPAQVTVRPPTVNVAPPKVTVKAPPPADVHVHVPPQPKPPGLRITTSQGVKYITPIEDPGEA